MIKKFVAILAGILFISFLSGCGSQHSSFSSSPAAAVAPITVSPNGQWVQTKSGLPKIVMTADISDGVIVITLSTGGTSGVYWDGTFDTGKFMSETVSDADTSAMLVGMYTSQDSTKKFTYKDGDLSFPFSILGVSTVVHMSKK